MAGKEKQPWNDQHPTVRVKWISTCGRCWFSASSTLSSGSPRHNPSKMTTNVSNSFPHIVKTSPDKQIYLFQPLLALRDIWIPQKSSFWHPDGINFIKITQLANIVNVDARHSILLGTLSKTKWRGGIPPIPPPSNKSVCKRTLSGNGGYPPPS